MKEWLLNHPRFVQRFAQIALIAAIVINVGLGVTGLSWLPALTWFVAGACSSMFILINFIIPPLMLRTYRITAAQREIAEQEFAQIMMSSVERVKNATGLDIEIGDTNIPGLSAAALYRGRKPH